MLWSDPILTCHEEMNKYVESTKVYTAFLFVGHAFWKENIEGRVKLLESNYLNCCVQVTTAYLRRKGLKMKEWHFRELSSWAKI